MGCKVSVKDEGLVQVYLNIEKNVLYCIANGKIQEKFDIGNYYQFVPIIKYDGDAHQSNKVMVCPLFDIQPPTSIETMTVNEVPKSTSSQDDLVEQKSKKDTYKKKNNQTNSIL